MVTTGIFLCKTGLAPGTEIAVSSGGRRIDMKKVLLGSLLAGGLLFAAKNNEVQTNRVSANERLALETQSPRVHPARVHKHQNKTHRMDQVASDKHTVNAYIPQGK